MSLCKADLESQTVAGVAESPKPIIPALALDVLSIPVGDLSLFCMTYTFIKQAADGTHLSRAALSVYAVVLYFFGHNIDAMPKRRVGFWLCSMSLTAMIFICTIPGQLGPAFTVLLAFEMFTVGTGMMFSWKKKPSRLFVATREAPSPSAIVDGTKGGEQQVAVVTAASPHPFTAGAAKDAEMSG